MFRTVEEKGTVHEEVYGLSEKRKYRFKKVNSPIRTIWHVVKFTFIVVWMKNYMFCYCFDLLYMHCFCLQQIICIVIVMIYFIYIVFVYNKKIIAFVFVMSIWGRLINAGIFVILGCLWVAAENKKGGKNDNWKCTKIT